MKVKKRSSLLIFSVTILSLAFSAQARNTILSGGAQTTLDFDDRTERGGDLAIEEDNKTTRFVISPFIRINSTSERDAVELYYAPGFSWDLEESDDYINHDFSIIGNRYVTQQWNLSFRDIYAYSDDSGVTTGNTLASEDQTTGSASASTAPDSTLSGDAGRREYQTNRLNILSEYTYVEDSVFSLGYTYSLLRNEDTGIGGYEDYDRHEGYLGLSYRFDPRWKILFDGRFIKGDYDPPELAIDEIDQLSNDLNEYRADLKLESDVFPHDPLFLLYGYVGTNFDEPLRNDNDIHKLTLGWQREFSPRLTFGLGGGPTYVKVEGSSSDTELNAFMDLIYTIEHGSIVLGALAGVDEENFSGTDQRGPVTFSEINGAFTYNFTQYLSFLLDALYRDEDREDIVVTDDIGLQEYSVERYEVGATLQYAFWQWYFASVSYRYTDQDSERIRSDYDEHRVLLRLGVEKDLFKW